MAMLTKIMQTYRVLVQFLAIDLLTIIMYTLKQVFLKLACKLTILVMYVIPSKYVIQQTDVWVWALILIKLSPGWSLGCFPNGRHTHKHTGERERERESQWLDWNVQTQ